MQLGQKKKPDHLSGVGPASKTFERLGLMPKFMGTDLLEHALPMPSRSGHEPGVEGAAAA
ncbi:hypothetical protein DBR47_04975 [Paucibacter sp. KBW04]|nr:hypothetical protein DBR47_04975 [Paucibacter sp. KBW04]